MIIEKEYWDKSGASLVLRNNFIRNDHGFSTHSIDGDVLVIGSVYGDGEYWNKFFHGVAKDNGCKKMRFTTRRNPDAWERKFDFKCVGWVLEKEVE